MLWDACDIPNECYRVLLLPKNVDISIEMTVDMKTFIKRHILKSILSDLYFFFLPPIIRCPLLKCKGVAYLAELQHVAITHQALLPFHNTF